MQLSEIRTLTRTLLSEPTASYWSDSELNNYINYGLADFCNQTEVLEKIYTLSQVQYQADYSWPTNCKRIKQIEVVKGNAAYLMQPEDLREHFTGIVKTTSTPPMAANIFADRIRLRERPSASAASTTLAAAITTTSATTFTLTDSSSFPRAGRVLIDSEVIEYWMNTSNTMSVCTRGAEGTTATAHIIGSTVTLRDIWVYCYAGPTTLSLDSDEPEIPGQFHQALSFYCAWLGRMKSKDFDLAAQNKASYDEFVAKGAEYAKTKWKRPYNPK